MLLWLHMLLPCLIFWDLRSVVSIFRHISLIFFFSFQVPIIPSLQQRGRANPRLPCCSVSGKFPLTTNYLPTEFYCFRKPQFLSLKLIVPYKEVLAKYQSFPWFLPCEFSQEFGPAPSSHSRVYQNCMNLPSPCCLTFCRNRLSYLRYSSLQDGIFRTPSSAPICSPIALSIFFSYPRLLPVCFRAIFSKLLNITNLPLSFSPWVFPSGSEMTHHNSVELL